MAPIDSLKHINLSELTGKDRSDFKKSLQQQKKDLQAAIKQIDKSIVALGKKKKKKKSRAKR